MEKIPAFFKKGGLRKYAFGHNPRTDPLKTKKGNPEMVECACGCRKLRRKYDVNGNRRYCINGHQQKNAGKGVSEIERFLFIWLYGHKGCVGYAS